MDSYLNKRWISELLTAIKETGNWSYYLADNILSITAKLHYSTSSMHIFVVDDGGICITWCPNIDAVKFDSIERFNDLFTKLNQFSESGSFTYDAGYYVIFQYFLDQDVLDELLSWTVVESAQYIILCARDIFLSLDHFCPLLVSTIEGDSVKQNQLLELICVDKDTMTKM